MVEPSIEIQELLHTLDSAYSRAQWRDRGKGLGEVQVDYAESGQPVFSVLIQGISDANREAVGFIARDLSYSLNNAYASIQEDFDAMGEEPTSIVGQAGFRDTAESVLDRNENVAQKYKLKLELRRA